jgi:SAM-dependent methyltransferase
MRIVSHGHDWVPGSSTDCHEHNLDIQKIRVALTEFELGRFLLSNLGLNGYWTSYVLLHPDKGRHTRLSSDGTPLTDLEAWLLDRCPIFLATQERFRTFRQLTQPHIASGMRLASIPSGRMDDLLTLSYAGTQNVELTAVDLDPASLEHARQAYERTGLTIKVDFEENDAWTLGSIERWDLITSNGLNIYVEDNRRCVALYQSIAAALRPQGLFIMSFITPPDQWRPYNAEDLNFQRFLFRDALPVKWQSMRDEKTIKAQLSKAGLEVLSVVYDNQRMFPAVLSRKHLRES